MTEQQMELYKRTKERMRRLGIENPADVIVALAEEIEGYRKQSEWISVDERLPEEDTIVLVWCGEVSVYNYLHNDLWYTGYCYITTSEGGVTHWMPLPEAPKMKGGAEETPKKHFTPEDVRKMSRTEVRENYTAIMDSMKEWK